MPLPMTLQEEITDLKELISVYRADISNACSITTFELNDGNLEEARSMAKYADERRGLLYDAAAKLHNLLT